MWFPNPPDTNAEEHDVSSQIACPFGEITWRLCEIVNDVPERYLMLHKN